MKLKKIIMRLMKVQKRLGDYYIEGCVASDLFALYKDVQDIEYDLLALDFETEPMDIAPIRRAETALESSQIDEN